jgi:hypothetical protein
LDDLRLENKKTECENMLKVNVKLKVFLPSPLRHMEGAEEQLHSLLSSAIDRGEERV